MSSRDRDDRRDPRRLRRGPATCPTTPPWVAAVVLAVTMFIAPLAADEPDAAQAARDATIVEAVLKLGNFDLNSSAKAKAAVVRYLHAHRGSDRWLELIDRFNLRDQSGDLLAVALQKPDDTVGVDAARLLLKFDAVDSVKAAVADKKDDKRAAAALTVLGHVGDKRALALVAPVVTDTTRSLTVRSAAVAALGRTITGQRTLLDMVTARTLPADLSFSAANVLLASPDPAVRAEAGKHLQLPASANSKPLPPIAELIKRTGDAAHGREVFFSDTVKCSTCHQVNGQGRQVGPELSEIGTKLPKEALYASILDPSAGISFNFESTLIETGDGRQIIGIVTSDTAESLTLRTPDAITATYKKSEIFSRRKLPTSIMPSDLQRTMKEQDLVDVVEFLSTLKKAKSGP